MPIAPAEARDYFVSVPIAAARLGITPNLIYQWISRGHLTPRRHGRRVLVCWDDVLDVNLAVQIRDRSGFAARRVDASSS